MLAKVLVCVLLPCMMTGTMAADFCYSDVVGACSPAGKRLHHLLPTYQLPLMLLVGFKFPIPTNSLEYLRPLHVEKVYGIGIDVDIKI